VKYVFKFRERFVEIARTDTVFNRNADAKRF